MQMEKDAKVTASLVPASELLSQTILTIFDTVHTAKAINIQDANFKQFTIYLEKVTVVLKELANLKIDDSESLKIAIEILNREIKVGKQLTVDCGKRNKFYLLVNCQRIAKNLDCITQEISRVLGLIPDISFSINDKISKLRKDMSDSKYQTTAMEDEILKKIETGIQETNVDKSYANNLLLSIADAAGISTERLVLKREFEEFKCEIEDVSLRKDSEEALKMGKIVALLAKADAATCLEEKQIKYFSKRNSLGRLPLEPLQAFYCPITNDVMVDPVETSAGRTFERSALEKWFAEGNNLCPLTATPLDMSALRPNKILRQSIEEWNERNTMIMLASLKPTLHSNDEQELLQSLGKLHDLCIEQGVHLDWVMMEEYSPILIGLLGVKNSEIRKLALAILCILAKDSNDNKERISRVHNAIESIVRSLARQIEERKLALQLLLELSRSNPVRDSIGNVQGCILLIVTISSSDDTQAAKDAKELLENLSVIDRNVIQMARANYFKPLLHLLSSGPVNARKTMAATLSEIDLTDHNKLNLFRDGALEPLVELITHGDMDMKTVAVKALYNLSSVPQNGLQMIREGAAEPLFEFLYRHSLSSASLRGEVAAIIMHLAISTTTLEADDEMHVSFLESEEDIFKLFSLISLTGPDIQQIILRTLHAMCQSHSGLDIRTKLRQLSSVRVLVQLCEFDNPAVRANAVKLFCCLTEDGEDSTFLEHVNQKCVETLLRIIKTSNNVEIADAMRIISNLPKEPHITQWLLDAGALQIILTCASDGNSSASYKRQLTENAIGALCRFTVSTNQDWQLEVAKSGFFPILVQLLDSGTTLTKRDAAVSLKQFSESSNVLSQPVKKHGCFRCCFASHGPPCPVHLGICTVESSFCLLEANAVEPLVRVLQEADVGACEASLDALLTLIDGERLQNGSKVLSDANAIVPIISLLSSSCTKLQEKALKALERIFRLIDFKLKYGQVAQMPLVDIAQRGNSGMKSLAAKVLAHLDQLQQQSSYF